MLKKNSKKFNYRTKQNKQWVEVASCITVVNK